MQKESTDWVAEDRRVFGITGDWCAVTLDPGVLYNTVSEGSCRFMVAWVRGEENDSDN